MTDDTKDFLALELVVAAAVAITSVLVMALVEMSLAVRVPYLPTAASLYGLRCVWWGVQHARTRPALREPVAHWLRVCAIVTLLMGFWALAFGMLVPSARGIVLGPLFIAASAFLFRSAYTLAHPRRARRPAAGTPTPPTPPGTSV